MTAKKKKSQELSLLDDAKVPAKVTNTLPASPTPIESFNAAIAAGATVEQLQMMMDLQERYEANEAKKEFHQAMAGFRGEAVKIIKRKKAGLDHKSGGGRTEYWYADLADVVSASVPAMSEWGLSHHWQTSQEPNGLITVTCFLTHARGHSISTPLHGMPDGTGSKNPVQSIKSTVSYLERMTFLAVTGLAEEGMDDDGKGTKSKDEPTLTDQEAATIEKLLKSSGRDRDLFLQYCKVEKVEDIKKKNFDFIVKKLKEKESE